MARFSVTYNVRGSMTETFEAGSLEAAKKMAAETADDEDYEFDLDTIDDVNFSVHELHPVIRDGKKIWTSYVRKTDTIGFGE